MALLMEPGQTYDSWDEFKAALDTHSKENKVIFNIANAKTVEQSNAFMKRGPFFDLRLKYSHCVLQCKHFGSYTSSSAGLRPKQRSYKINCQAFISVSACRKKNYLIIRDSYHKHSHPCTEEIYNSYPEVRRMTKDERRMVGTLLDMGVPVSQIKSAVGKNVTPKDLHNAKIHMRLVKMGVKGEERKLRAATKRDAFLLEKEGKGERMQTEIVIEEREESVSTEVTDTDEQHDNSHKESAAEISVPIENTASFSSEQDSTVSDGTFVAEEKVTESCETSAVTNFLNSLGPNTESVIAVPNSDDGGDKTSYTVIVSTAGGEKDSAQVVTGLQELFDRLQAGSIQKKPTTPTKVPKTEILDQVEDHTEGHVNMKMVEKNCEGCQKYMSPLDGHSLCLVCLGPQHLHIEDCEYCRVMKPEQLNIRRKLLVRMRMKALKELNESKRQSSFSPESQDVQSTSDNSVFQPRKSKRVRKPKDFGPDISVQSIFSQKSPSKMTKCVVSDGDKEYTVEIPKREVEDDYEDFSSEVETSVQASFSKNGERFDHLLKQTEVFGDVVLRNTGSDGLGYYPDVESVLEVSNAMSHSNISAIPKGLEGKYCLDSKFEDSYCPLPSAFVVPGDTVLNTMSNGLHKLAQNATVQTRLAIYDKLFTRLGVGMADEALGILSHLYGKVTQVTEISQDDLTNDLQTALDTIQALKDVLEELGLMSKDALSTASHQRSLSFHSLDRAKNAFKRPRKSNEVPLSSAKRRKFEPFTKSRLTSEFACSESQSSSQSFQEEPVHMKTDVSVSAPNDERTEHHHHIVMEVSSLPSEISPSVLAPIMSVSPSMALSEELLARLQSQKDSIIELKMGKAEDEAVSSARTVGESTAAEVSEVVQSNHDNLIHTSGEIV